MSHFRFTVLANAHEPASRSFEPTAMAALSL